MTTCSVCPHMAARLLFGGCRSFYNPRSFQNLVLCSVGMGWLGTPRGPSAWSGKARLVQQLFCLGLPESFFSCVCVCMCGGGGGYHLPLLPSAKPPLCLTRESRYAHQEELRLVKPFSANPPGILLFIWGEDWGLENQGTGFVRVKHLAVRLWGHARPEKR